MCVSKMEMDSFERKKKIKKWVNLSEANCDDRSISGLENEFVQHLLAKNESDASE